MHTPELPFDFSLPLPAEDRLPSAWAALLPPEVVEAPLARVAKERKAGEEVYPPSGMLFRALALTPPEKLKAVILGQDPYHEPGQACGLAFAVPPECHRLPPSLKNILKEYSDDLGWQPPLHPDLSCWARAGVLLLNTVLSVRAHAAFSHAGFGWQNVTDAILTAISRNLPPTVFLLWGAPAQSKRPGIDETRHRVLCAPHPSPLSAYRGFFGSRPFSKCNEALKSMGREEVDWRL